MKGLTAILFAIVLMFSVGGIIYLFSLNGTLAADGKEIDVIIPAIGLSILWLWSALAYCGVVRLPQTSDFDRTK